MIIAPTNTNHTAAILTPKKSKGLTATASKFVKWLARLSKLPTIPVVVVAIVTVFPPLTFVFCNHAGHRARRTCGTHRSDVGIDSRACDRVGGGLGVGA